MMKSDAGLAWIGQSIEEFKKVFGEPVKSQGMLDYFDLGDEDSSYLITSKLDDCVYNISFSSKTNDETERLGIELFAENFLPFDSTLTLRVENEIFTLVNGDAPITIREYYSEFVMDSKGFIPNEDDKGFITIYICREGYETRIVVALGKEEELRIKN